VFVFIKNFVSEGSRFLSLGIQNTCTPGLGQKYLQEGGPHSHVKGATCMDISEENKIQMKNHGRKQQF
jgi:hypothetical protein